ncbi:hypothetical protein BJV82DRAFT_658869 [Fennellomyces sp. T-0311]|nr:hypothetical protein BJV82DRAFT_658869 [Fennellomyces sp. T-0311]
MAYQHSPRVKPDPQDQEDLFMSYLNTDCMSNASSSSSDTSSTPWSSPRKSNSVILTPTGESEDNLWCPNYFAAVAAAARHNVPVSSGTLVDPYYAAASSSTSCLPLPPPELLAAMHQPVMPYIQPYTTTVQHGPDDSQQSQPKRKRGRKKRDISPPSSNTLAIAPAPATSTTTVVNTPSLPTSSSTLSTPDPGDNNSNYNSEDEKAAAALAKRQERLIKNRAAALLSRKRKREHVNALEEQNGALKAQVSELESRVQSLTLALNQQKSSATTSVVFMIILFSFAIFSLPRTGKPLIRSASNEKESTKIYLESQLWESQGNGELGETT